jgi:hypothetical protein
MFSALIERALRAAVAAHDARVRSGLVSVSSSVHPLHVALMLARWGQDEEVIVAGLAQGLVAGSDVWSTERVTTEFGPRVGSILEELSECVPLDPGARRGRGLEGVAHMSPLAATVQASAVLHQLQGLLLELREGTDTAEVWSRFEAGPEPTLEAAAELVAALTQRVEPRVARALNAALQALVEHERATAVGRAS